MSAHMASGSWTRSWCRSATGNTPDDYTNVILVTKLTGKAGFADAVYLDYHPNQRAAGPEAAPVAE
jgi:hypothetical protein